MQFKFRLMRPISFLFFVTVLLFATNSYSEGVSCKTLGDSLFGCTPFECDTTAPEMKGQKIHNKIVGLNEAGQCVHEQANPDGEKVICKYSEESRKFLGIRLKKAGSDLANMPESSEFEENILADIFHNECDVISSKAADDKPVVTGDEEPESLDTDYNEEDEAGAEPSDAASELPADVIEDNGDLVDEMK
jgi:hypothetical protein